MRDDTTRTTELHNTHDVGFAVIVVDEKGYCSFLCPLFGSFSIKSIWKLPVSLLIRVSDSLSKERQQLRSKFSIRLENSHWQIRRKILKKKLDSVAFMVAYYSAP
uniref:Uncharacterized protein n=1 Tax=Amphora coffeiformis TaxID=265554 RepID=A0A7S3L8Q3_9STRA|mmetsp:Transcript_12514/g.25303  ORF Transcript_12514/g.25303 Transcript_12514/m.25303 type:complete len:105 (+) Transcript_12514:128-442(+)